MKKILALVVSVFAFNVLAGAPPPTEPKKEDKTAKKTPEKKDAAKPDAGTAM